MFYVTDFLSINSLWNDISVVVYWRVVYLWSTQMCPLQPDSVSNQ